MLVCRVCAGLWAEEVLSVSPAWLQLWAVWWKSVTQKKKINQSDTLFIKAFTWCSRE